MPQFGTAEKGSSKDMRGGDGGTSRFQPDATAMRSDRSVPTAGAIVTTDQDGPATTSSPYSQQIRAITVAMVKSSVPRGEQNPTKGFTTAMWIARPHHAGECPLVQTMRVFSRKAARNDAHPT